MEFEQKIVHYETTDFENSFQLVHKITTRRFQYGSHIHTHFYEIHFMLRGDMDIAIDGTKKKLVRGDVTVISPGEIHRPYINSNREYERTVLHVSDHLLAELSTPYTNFQSMFRSNRLHFIHFTEEELKGLLVCADQIKKYVDNPGLMGADIMQQSYLNIVLLQILEKLQAAGEDEKKGVGYQESSPLIEGAVDYINRHLTEDITVQSIAEYLNVSRSYVSRVFKERTGSTLWGYVVAKRLILSQRLMLEGKSITEACYDSGFRDYAHFIKSFSKKFGMPPGKYAGQVIKQITINIED